MPLAAQINNRVAVKVWGRLGRERPRRPLSRTAVRGRLRRPRAAPYLIRKTQTAAQLARKDITPAIAA